jgi:hypothetical protein
MMKESIADDRLKARLYGGGTKYAGAGWMNEAPDAGILTWRIGGLYNLAG